MRILRLALPLVLVATATLAAEHGAEIVDQAWKTAVLAGDVDAIVDLYVDDAVIYPPDAAVITGKEGIREYWAGFVANFTAESVEFTGQYESAGDTSFGWGTWAMTMAPRDGGESMSMQGRVTVIVKKVGDEWKYVVDHASVPFGPPPDSP